MATNYFLPFASSTDANVLTDAQYRTALASGGTYAAGVVSGQASSQQANKTWRQSTALSAALGQLIVTQINADASDSQATATLAQNLGYAIQTFGGVLPFNADFANAVNGYPKNAIVADASLAGLFWASTADSNTTTPGASGASWMPLTSGMLLKTTVFQPGPSTWTPNPLTSTARYRMAGAGASGGGCPALDADATTGCVSTGGGAGAYEEGIMAFARGALSAGIAVVVGTGGAAPTAGQNNGNPGIASSIGGRTCAGGPAGLAGGAYTPPFFVALGSIAGVPSGSIASGVSLQTLVSDPGGQAGTGIALRTDYLLSGNGGNSLIGHGGIYGQNGGASSGAQGYGGGGSGTATQPGNPATSGGGGGPGYIQIDEYL